MPRKKDRKSGMTSQPKPRKTKVATDTKTTESQLASIYSEVAKNLTTIQSILVAAETFEQKAQEKFDEIRVQLYLGKPTSAIFHELHSEFKNKIMDRFEPLVAKQNKEHDEYTQKFANIVNDFAESGEYKCQITADEIDIAFKDFEEVKSKIDPIIEELMQSFTETAETLKPRNSVKVKLEYQISLAEMAVNRAVEELGALVLQLSGLEPKETDPKDLPAIHKRLTDELAKATTAFSKLRC